MPVSDKPSSFMRKLEATNRTEETGFYGDNIGLRRRSKRLKRSTCSIEYEYNSDGIDNNTSNSPKDTIDGHGDSTDFEDESNNAVGNREIGSRWGTPNSNAKRGKPVIRNRSVSGECKGDLKAQPKKLKKAFKCPHCGKNFQTSSGLRYHIENLVCRAEGRAKKKANDTEKSRKAAHELGEPNQDRTCPHCKRVFKSIDGMRYHVEQKVCRRASLTRTRDGRVRPFPALHQGQKFVTPFGVVEVLKDDRAVPTAILPPDIQDRFRKYQKSKGTDSIRAMGRYVKRSGKLRVRRNAISSLYEKGKANRRSVFEAYFGGDPEHIRSVIQATKAIESARSTPSSKKSSTGSSASTDADVASTSLYRRISDPREPKASFPDRIVECKWIVDHRSHIFGLGSFHTKEAVKRDSEQNSKKLYLQRKLLTQPYDESDRVYYCPDCGRKFSSSQSCKSHCVQKKCMKEARVKKEKRDAVQFKIALEVEHCIRFPEKRKFVKNKNRTPVLVQNGKPSKWKKKKKPELGYYPQLILAMGFKLVAKEKISFTNPVPEPPSLSLTEVGPDHILDDLKGAFEVQMRKASDQKHGSVYAEVYKALGFKHARKRKGAKVGNNVGERKRRKRDVKPKITPPPKPLPPAIDVRALVDEIKSGRYPSIKVFIGNHAESCVICRKNEGKMFHCEFCDSVEHFKCILSKFTVKEPEPDENFMCHKCIGIILSRRARAEKRRLRKQANNEKLKREKAFAERENSDGNEYPYMASQAREVNELVELLKDSQVRLRRSIETTKLNNIRRQVISGVYPDIYSKPY